MSEQKTEPREWPSEMVEACRKTIAAYDRLIETGDYSGWYCYPKAYACRLCVLLDYLKITKEACVLCPISGGLARGCNGQTMDKLYSAIQNENEEGNIIGVAKRRRKLLLDRMRRAGIEI